MIRKNPKNFYEKLTQSFFITKFVIFNFKEFRVNKFSGENIIF